MFLFDRIDRVGRNFRIDKLQGGKMLSLSKCFDNFIVERCALKIKTIDSPQFGYLKQILLRAMPFLTERYLHIVHIRLHIHRRRQGAPTVVGKPHASLIQILRGLGNNGRMFAQLHQVLECCHGQLVVARAGEPAHDPNGAVGRFRSIAVGNHQ